VPLLNVTEPVAVGLPPTPIATVTDCNVLMLNGVGVTVTVGVVAFVTITSRLAVLFRFPEVPVTVTIADPRVAALVALRVKMLLCAVLAGLNDAVTPAGSPDAERLTLP
jgi:hypothetical protein